MDRPELGWPGLRLSGDNMGTEDGLTKYPYIHESRRIKAVFTVLEVHVGPENGSWVTGKKSKILRQIFKEVWVTDIIIPIFIRVVEK